MQTVNYRKGLGAMSVCFFVWGFQPLYWYMSVSYTHLTLPTILRV